MLAVNINSISVPPNSRLSMKLTPAPSSGFQQHNGGAFQQSHTDPLAAHDLEDDEFDILVKSRRTSAPAVPLPSVSRSRLFPSNSFSYSPSPGLRAFGNRENRFDINRIPSPNSLGQEKLRITWNHVHKLIVGATERYRIAENFRPDVIVCTSMSALMPAKILHNIIQSNTTRQIALLAMKITFPENNRNSIGSNNSNSDLSAASWIVIEPGALPQIEPANPAPFDFLGKNVLLMDCASSSGTIFAAAFPHLKPAHVKKQSLDFSSLLMSRQLSGSSLTSLSSHSKSSEPENGVELPPRTRFGVFVIHDKAIARNLEVMKACEDGRTYYAAASLLDDGIDDDSPWILYPWEVVDIDEHDKLAIMQEKFLPWAYPQEVQTKRLSGFDFGEVSIKVGSTGKRRVAESKIRRFAAAMQEDVN